MKDCSQDIRDYEMDSVALSSQQRRELLERRSANRERVEKGLSKNGEPRPMRFVPQGSFSMETTIQEPSREYDIDDGVVFLKEDLVGPNGGDKGALEARSMVRDAVDDGSFLSPPETRTNCVRIFYADGPHVDMPVYRTPDTGSESSIELASAEWRVSDPEGVNSWFSDWLDRLSEPAQLQCRQLIRLIKSYCKQRPSYSLPSGLVITVLVEESYRVEDERLDRALRAIMTSIHTRLGGDLSVRHPVVDEWLVEPGKAAQTKNLRDLFSTAIKDFEELDLPNCTRSRALKVWKKVLATDYFDSKIKESEEKEKSRASAAVACMGASPKPWTA